MMMMIAIIMMIIVIRNRRRVRRLGGDIRLCLWAGRLPSLTPKGRPTDSLSVRGHHHPFHPDRHLRRRHWRGPHHSSVFTCVPWMAWWARCKKRNQEPPTTYLLLPLLLAPHFLLISEIYSYFSLKYILLLFLKYIILGNIFPRNHLVIIFFEIYSF